MKKMGYSTKHQKIKTEVFVTFTKKRIHASLWILGVLFVSIIKGHSQPKGPIDFEHIYSKKLNEAHDDFNFWNGNWDLVWKTWAGNDTYTPYDYSQQRVFSALDGKALIELTYSDSAVQGIKTAGFSIRYFDDHLQKWVMLQSWPGKSSTNISSLQGTYHHERIQLYQHGKTTRKIGNNPIGTPYSNRYTFSDTHPETFRWESSFSLDSMKTWFTRNVAEGTRRPDFKDLMIDQNKWYTYGDGSNCNDSILVPLKPFLGEWGGEIKYMNGKSKNTYKVSRVLLPFLGNCGALGYQISFKEETISKEIIFITYLTASNEWVFYSLNNNLGESHKTFFSRTIDDETNFIKRDLFGVVSSGSLREFTWNLKKPGRQIIRGSIPEQDWSFKIELTKINDRSNY